MTASPYEDQSDSETSVLLAFLCGMVAGAAVGLLFAPAEGREARESMANTARKGREKAAGAAEQGREVWERQREHFDSAVALGRDAYKQARDRVRTDGPPEEAGGLEGSDVTANQ